MARITVSAYIPCYNEKASVVAAVRLNGPFEISWFIGKMLLSIVEAPADVFNQDGAQIVKALVALERRRTGLWEQQRA
jgi:hypothetical protein